MLAFLDEIYTSKYEFIVIIGANLALKKACLVRERAPQ